MGSAPFMLYRTGEATMLARVKNAKVSGPLEGTWSGSLDVGGNQIGLILTIANRPDGTARCSSRRRSGPRCGGRRAQRKRHGDLVQVPATQGAWSGTLDGDALTGTWSQQGGSLPLTLTRQK
jgi:hypothetical protein